MSLLGLSCGNVKNNGNEKPDMWPREAEHTCPLTLRTEARARTSSECSDSENECAGIGVEEGLHITRVSIHGHEQDPHGFASVHRVQHPKRQPIVTQLTVMGAVHQSKVRPTPIATASCVPPPASTIFLDAAPSRVTTLKALGVH